MFLPNHDTHCRAHTQRLQGVRSPGFLCPVRAQKIAARREMYTMLFGAGDILKSSITK